jgi:diketogulonate reductase-like aldo/keto reductase
MTYLAALSLIFATLVTGRPGGTSGAFVENANQPAQIPIVGLGTWHLQDKGNNVTEEISRVIEMGYRHIDCAANYRNQKEVGLGIKAGLQKTGLKREDLWVTSKLRTSRWESRYTLSR